MTEKYCARGLTIHGEQIPLHEHMGRDDVCFCPYEPRCSERGDAEIVTHVFHTYPKADVIEHDTSSEFACGCGPDLEPVIVDGDITGWLVKHRKADA